MQVIPFTDQYAAAAALYGSTAGELRRRDAASGTPARWLAFRDGTVCAAVSARLRPDDRLFLSFAGDMEAYAPLTEAVAAEQAGPLHTHAAESEDAARDALGRAGFVTEVVFERFSVPFAPVLARLERARIPPGFELLRADEADEARLFALDTALRGEVPGTDGWRGDRAAFHDELAEAPPFDPSAYLLGVAPGPVHAGLCRVWRNPSGPRLGLLGVLAPYRTTTLAAALLVHALQAAAGWGHAAFTTEAATSNRAVHPRLVRLGAERLGRFRQLVRPGPASATSRRGSSGSSIR